MVLEGFWAENIDFSLVFEDFGWGEGLDAVGDAAGLGPPKPRFFKEKHQDQGQGVKGKGVINTQSHPCAKRDGGYDLSIYK